MVDFRKSSRVDGIVEEIIVGAADVDVELAVQFRPERRPVALQNGAEIVVFPPVSGDRRIDLAGFLIEDRFRITVFSRRAEHRLPDIELLSGAAVSAQASSYG